MWRLQGKPTPTVTGSRGPTVTGSRGKFDALGDEIVVPVPLNQMKKLNPTDLFSKSPPKETWTRSDGDGWATVGKPVSKERGFPNQSAGRGFSNRNKSNSTKGYAGKKVEDEATKDMKKYCREVVLGEVRKWKQVESSVEDCARYIYRIIEGIQTQNGQKDMQKRGKILELLIALWWHEILVAEFEGEVANIVTGKYTMCKMRLLDYFKNKFSGGNAAQVSESDGHSALNYTVWPEFMNTFGKLYEALKLMGYTRNEQDFYTTANLLMEVGNSPATKSGKGENVLKSAEQAAQKGYIDQELHRRMAKFFIDNAMKHELAAENIVKNLVNKMCVETSDAWRPTFCWIFRLDPKLVCKSICELFIKNVKAERGVWQMVCDIIDFYRKLIANGPAGKDFKLIEELFTGDGVWNPDIELEIFNRGMVEAVHLIEDGRRSESSFYQPLGAVVGECGNDTEIRDYLTSHFYPSEETSPEEKNQKEGMAFYCYTHSLSTDPDSVEIMCQKIGTIAKAYQTMLQIALTRYVPKDSKNPFISTWSEKMHGLKKNVDFEIRSIGACILVLRNREITESEVSSSVQIVEITINPETDFEEPSTTLIGLSKKYFDLFGKGYDPDCECTKIYIDEARKKFVEELMSEYQNGSNPLMLENFAYLSFLHAVSTPKVEGLKSLSQEINIRDKKHLVLLQAKLKNLEDKDVINSLLEDLSSKIVKDIHAVFAEMVQM